MFSAQNLINLTRSPSMRREWIEMFHLAFFLDFWNRVSLHAEGVD